MTPEEENGFLAMQHQVQLEQARRMEAETKVSQMSGFQAGKEPNIIEYQLDISQTLDRIYHQLSGHVVKLNQDKSETWEEPDDDRLKILSDYGVKQIMNLLSMYISPDTLLANLTEEQVYWITLDFGVELIDLMYCRYELFYSYPTPEELLEKYKPIAKAKGLNITDRELYFKCVQWSREELQMKFRHFPMQVNMIIHKVFINLTRAINGEERESLRKQYNIHQSLNGPQPLHYTNPSQRPSIFKPSTWK